MLKEYRVYRHSKYLLAYNEMVQGQLEIYYKHAIGTPEAENEVKSNVVKIAKRMENLEQVIEQMENKLFRTGENLAVQQMIIDGPHEEITPFPVRKAQESEDPDMVAKPEPEKPKEPAPKE